MPELPAVSGKQAVKAFGRAGFVLDRIEGSHHILKRPGRVYVLAVPVHGQKDLKRGTLRALIRGAGLTVAEFQELLD